MCLNGGTLHLCDNCPQAVFHQCLPPTPDVDISDLDFLCLACHEENIQEGPCAILCQCQSFDVPYLTHFPLLVGILCLAKIRSQWSKCSPATFLPETRHE